MARETIREMEKRLQLKNKRPSMPMLVKQVILHTFDQIKTKAESESECNNKKVGCSILEIDLYNEMIEHFAAVNGPNVNQECKCKWNSDTKNINCNCNHAESRALMLYLKRFRQNRKNIKTILISSYCPCVYCANLIIDSGLIDVVAWDTYDNSLGFWTLDNSRDIRLWTKELIENDIENNYIKNWLLKN